jgi:hypothetical protein
MHNKFHVPTVACKVLLNMRVVSNLTLLWMSLSTGLIGPPSRRVGKPCYVGEFGAHFDGANR